jgi:hypothetical protein
MTMSLVGIIRPRKNGGLDCRDVFACGAGRASAYDDAMTITPIPMLLAAAMALTPLGPNQQARLAAWLDWAYRDCYMPAPFSLSIDEGFTARCIERTLRLQQSGPPNQRAATEALIAATPQLITMLNTPADQHVGASKSAKLDPPGR